MQMHQCQPDGFIFFFVCSVDDILYSLVAPPPSDGVLHLEYKQCLQEIACKYLCSVPLQYVLRHVRSLLLEQGIGKARKSILARQLEKHGGQAVASLSDDPTHILVGNNTKLARVPVLLKVSSIPETVSVLRADWLKPSNFPV